MIENTQKSLFFTKNDTEDLRFGDCAFSGVPSHSSESKYTIIGYQDDLGIFLNGGRIGARFAPQKIREYFYKTTPSLRFYKNDTKCQRLICDLGDLVFSTPQNQEKTTLISQLSAQHLEALNFIKQTSDQTKLITLGAGHDYAAVDGKLFLEKSKRLYPEKKPIILNFDAHMDVRPIIEGNENSGTPFFNLLNQFSDEFQLIEIGIQSQCNSPIHIEWAKKQGTLIFTNDDILKTEFLSELASFLYNFKDSPVYISVDIDGFHSSEAPGCSQSWQSGFSFSLFKLILNQIHQILTPIQLGIYEVSPPLDFDNRTSKLAALILHQFIELTYDPAE